MTYFYDAAGSKRRKEVYTEGIKTSVLDYAGSVVYRDDAPSYAVFEEGRILINPEETNFIEYHLKDHLGNVRVAYKEDNGLPVALQTNTYYPFGMLISELSTPDLNCPNPLKYNAKELQPDFGLDWYDYGARFYDPQVGRWWGVDPLAEKARRWSPYHYCMNNPIRFIDPDGMAVFHSKALGLHWADDLVQDHSYQELLQSTMASNDEAAEKESSADEFSPQDGSQTEMNAGNGGGGDKKKKRSSASSTGGNASSTGGNPNSTGGNVQHAGVEGGEHYIGPALILLGQPLKVLKPVGALGSKPGSSIASYTLSKVFPQTFIKVLGKETGTKIATSLGTNVIGRAAGRFVPYVGWAWTAWDIGWTLGENYGPSKWFTPEPPKSILLEYMREHGMLDE